MKQIKQFIQQGLLTEALNSVMKALKSTPKDKELRSTFVELLCIDGQFERADQQLELIIKQHPECLPGVVNMRQLVRAAQARTDFSTGGDTGNTVGMEKQNLSALIKLRLAISSDNINELTESAKELELQRQSNELEVNGLRCSEVRDIDDSLAGYLEVFGANGLYYLVPLENITWLKLLPATSLFELVWRRAEIDIHNGPSGEVFVPVTYLGSETDAEKLGRETDWQSMLGTDFYQGRGLKMFLNNDTAQAITQWQSFQAPESLKDTA